MSAEAIDGGDEEAREHLSRAAVNRLLAGIGVSSGGPRGTTGFGMTATVVARNPCPTHGYCHKDGDECQLGLIGRSG